MEKIRQDMLLVGELLKQMDDLTNNINDARWKYEMLSRKPQLGGKTTPDMLADNIRDLTEQRDTAGEILTTLTGKDSVEAARHAYLTLGTAYQRLANLREVQAAIRAGVTVSEETRKALGASVEGVDHAIAVAEKTVTHVAIHIKPIPSKLLISPDAPARISLR